MVEAQLPSADSKPEPDLSGRRLGDYQLMRRLARGGMADVYLAEQQSLRRQIAFKVLRSNLAGDETYVRRFHHEAQAAASLVHANIVQIYEVGCVAGTHFIAQEYVPGQNLKQFVARRGPLKLPLAMSILRQVAAALHRASSGGIVHRDIKPENILLSPTLEVKVADFGLARIAGGDGQLNLTQVGVTLGTPLYMSPEQVEGRTLDPRSDLYSLGVTCYEMLTGQTPFSGDTALSVAIQHLQSEPPRIEDLRPDLPGGLCRIVHKMMAKKPAHRQQNAAELLRELRTLQVDGLDGQWPADAEVWETTGAMDLTNARLAATQQLNVVMKTESLVVRRGTRPRWLVLAVTAAFLLGVGAAWVKRPPPLLQVAGNETSRIQRQTTAEAQFWHAVAVGTEAALVAVPEYFRPEDSPENELYVNKARLQLAYLHAENEDWDQAVSILRDLAAQKADAGLQKSALIELASIHARRGEPFAANTYLLQLSRLVHERKLSPREKQEWIQLLPGNLRPQFEQMIEEQGQKEPPRPKPSG